MNAKLLIKAVERLVQNKEVRREDESAGQHKAAALPGGEKTETAVGQIGESELANEILKRRRIGGLDFLD